MDLLHSYQDLYSRLYNVLFSIIQRYRKTGLLSVAGTDREMYQFTIRAECSSSLFHTFATR